MGDKAGIALRVSTTGQDEENQIPANLAWCAAHDYEVARTYQLHGKSAYKGQQTAMLADILDDFRSGIITVLVVWRDDRLERRGSWEFITFIKQVVELGGRIEFVTQPQLNDLTNMGGRISLVVVAEMAYEDSKKKSENVMIGLDTARANGAATTKPPWGYYTEGARRNKRFVLGADCAELAPHIFEAVADGMSGTVAARTFSTESKQWSVTTLLAMIRNPVYKGIVLDKAGTIVHRCEAAVDAGLWARANKALAADERRRRGPGQPKAMLARVLKCECGAPMYRTPDEARRTMRYYRCSASHGVMVQTTMVEAAVERSVLQELGNVELTEPNVVPGTNWEAEIEETKFELQHLDLDAEDYDERHAVLRAKLAELKARPAVPDRVEDVPTGVTFGQKWSNLADQAERGDFLRSARVTVLIRKAEGVAWISYDWGSLAARFAVVVVDGERLWLKIG